MMDKLKMQSLDVTGSNINKIALLFPQCVTEHKDKDGKTVFGIDFEKLRDELSADVIDEGEERYQFTWPDKKTHAHLANTPTTKTLRPCCEESVDFDHTQNLYIEGDNLDVLKVIRETYLGKVKMIYIDPPYNTGNDFMYNDDFAQDTDEYKDNSGQLDEEGNRLVQNTESNGRFHTDWLNMIYPRLKVAKDLLSDDGALLMSIDNNEIEELIKIGKEIFGEQNYISTIANVNNPKGRSDDKFVATAHEYIIVFAKNIQSLNWYGFEPGEEIIKRYNKIDDEGNRYREIDLRKTGENDLREDRPNLFYYFYYDKESKNFFPSRNESINNCIQIKPQREDGREGNWRWGLDTAKEKLWKLEPKFMPSRKVWGIMEKDFLKDRDLVKPTSAWTFKDVNSERGTEDFITLGFDKRIFLKPKPIGTIKRCCNIALSKEGIVLDFFSGSATTAHAVMQLNAEDGGNRKFIMVQLPEKTDEKSEAYKAGYKNICEIGKERIRRAGKKIKEENAGKEGIDKLDTGFRVLKLDSSNMQDVYYTPKEFIEQNLFADNVKSDRTAEDLLFQVMLDLGVELSASIEQRTIDDKQVFFVNDNYLVACFDENIAESTITEIAKMKPYYFVMRDSSLASDNVADNFDQLFETYSKDTIRKII